MRWVAVRGAELAHASCSAASLRMRGRGRAERPAGGRLRRQRRGAAAGPGRAGPRRALQCRTRSEDRSLDCSAAPMACGGCRQPRPGEPKTQRVEGLGAALGACKDSGGPSRSETLPRRGTGPAAVPAFQQLPIGAKHSLGSEVCTLLSTPLAKPARCAAAAGWARGPQLLR
ncbi:uncharacterized protein LOC135186458 isoform X3 [Pogoniulus pusillus]|uniref:uncharacterized protein LOC135173960 isoform X3 n=1 Tax=Pogoniulus pusillus TaxID=488313 RepID=UPI0030B93E8B